MPTEYIWHATADLMGNGNHDFARNAAKLQESVKGFGVLAEVLDLIDIEAGRRR